MDDVTLKSDCWKFSSAIKGINYILQYNTFKIVNITVLLFLLYLVSRDPKRLNNSVGVIYIYI